MKTNEIKVNGKTLKPFDWYRFVISGIIDDYDIKITSFDLKTRKINFKFLDKPVCIAHIIAYTEQSSPLKKAAFAIINSNGKNKKEMGIVLKKFKKELSIMLLKYLISESEIKTN